MKIISDYWNQIKTLFSSRPIFMIGCLLVGLGVINLLISDWSFGWRAFTNKKAWGGKTVPTLIRGIILLIIGGLMIFADLYFSNQLS